MMLVALSLSKDGDVEMDASDLLPAWYNNAVSVLGVVHIAISAGVVTQYFVNQYTGEGLLSLFFADVTGSVYYLLFFAASVTGLFYHGYFYLFHMLYIVQNNKDLASAVNAVTYNGRSLLWVSALTLTIVYIFSVFAFIFFRRDFDNEDGMYCNSLLDCLGTLLANSLETGGIRDRLGPGVQIANATGYSTNQGWRIVLDLAFWAIIVIIMMNLVLGIIVTHSLSKEKSWRTEKTK